MSNENRANIDALLAPINSESPCGENLEYDDDFLLLEQSLVGKTEQQFGDFLIPAESPNWLEVEKQATNLLLTRTKDLRIIIALMHSWVEARGLSGYADGLDLIKQTLERYWDEVWPKLEFDGDYDPLFRLNTLADIEDGSPLILKVQNSILLKNVLQELSFRDVYSLLDGSITEISGYTGGRTRLLKELKQQSSSPEISILVGIRDHITTLNELIRRHLPDHHAIEFSLLLKHLNTVIEFSLLKTPSSAEAPTTDSNKTAPASESVNKPVSTSVKNTVIPAPSADLSSFDWYEVEAHNREEVRMLLEKVKLYFITHEPSHPAPMMIDRIQQLIDRNFIDIISNLAPEGLHQLAIIFGYADNSGTNTDTDETH
ncbi:type VI secretion system protein TssA [Xenorhabdus bharatensis]|uniref:type VI secretion system protein TssA n=1 Tax=Xenorhabdus bharatensis TaxID=3136256 RepID=UPI0030F48D16